MGRSARKGGGFRGNVAGPRSSRSRLPRKDRWPNSQQPLTVTLHPHPRISGLWLTEDARVFRELPASAAIWQRNTVFQSNRFVTFTRGEHGHGHDDLHERPADAPRGAAGCRAPGHQSRAEVAQGGQATRCRDHSGRGLVENRRLASAGAGVCSAGDSIAEAGGAVMASYVLVERLIGETAHPRSTAWRDDQDVLHVAPIDGGPETCYQPGLWVRASTGTAEQRTSIDATTPRLTRYQ